MTGDIFGFGPNIIRTPPRDTISKFARFTNINGAAFFLVNSVSTITNYNNLQQFVISFAFRTSAAPGTRVKGWKLGVTSTQNYTKATGTVEYAEPQSWSWASNYTGIEHRTSSASTNSGVVSYGSKEYPYINMQHNVWYLFQGSVFINSSGRKNESWFSVNGVKCLNHFAASNATNSEPGNYVWPLQFTGGEAAKCPTTIDVANIIMYGFDSANLTTDDGTELAGSLVNWSTGEFLEPLEEMGTPILHYNFADSSFTNKGSLGGVATPGYGGTGYGTPTISYIDVDETTRLNAPPVGKRNVFDCSVFTGGETFQTFIQYSTSDHDFTNDGLWDKKILIVRACQLDNNLYAGTTINYCKDYVSSAGATGWREKFGDGFYALEGTTASPKVDVTFGSGYKIILCLATPPGTIHWLRTKDTTYTQTGEIATTASIPSLQGTQYGVGWGIKNPVAGSVQPYRSVYSGIYTNKMMQDNPQIPWDDPAAMVAYFVQNDKYVKDLSKAISGITPLVIENSNTTRIYPNCSNGLAKEYVGMRGSNNKFIETIDDPFVT